MNFVLQWLTCCWAATLSLNLLEYKLKTVLCSLEKKCGACLKLHVETHAEDLVVAKVQNSKSVNLKDAECLRELLVHLNTGSKVFASREFWYWILFHKTKLFYCVFRCGFVGGFFWSKKLRLNITLKSMANYWEVYMHSVFEVFWGLARKTLEK